MPEADAEGASPLDRDNHIAREMPRQFYDMMYLYFYPPRISPKETDEASGGFLPRPLLLRLRNPKIAEVLRKTYPQKNVSAKPSPFLEFRIGILLEKSSDFVQETQLGT